ncbi:BZ3500_MvSof-1268-A1-R1_Chr5-2g08129 [Microbotryum saponariae]|uniref:BZ3500_MvSof-1268-A1-R1_Chr5-2g08129 protein n=1 Tax=Microbotryum saponariae TaxID=289078 RepID=A0A2X0L1Z9_9BASI|nr:BZ3500_MvSof-1268-A1-R1_Chr5-2g08129 [Microbotryum saponariae]SDA05998.1 BZ3501_MvSof-1269-A2-R1_Chr5-2g07951 [Microbotryum saponariae]
METLSESMATTSTKTLDTPSLKRTRGQSLLDDFAGFRTELDAHVGLSLPAIRDHRRERVIKTSRDITALSKKLIFTLHRITNTPRATVLKEAEAKIAQLRELFIKVHVEVQGDQFWRYVLDKRTCVNVILAEPLLLNPHHRYEKAISPGMQEYLEGWTFYYYILHRRIPTLSEAQASLLPPLPAESSESTTTPYERPPLVRVTGEDYLGGIADLTGELMRLAIASIGKSLAAATAAAGGDKGEDIDDLGRLVRAMKGDLDPLAPYARWLGKKLVVLDQSLSKIELASYNLKVRGAEFPDAQPRWTESDDRDSALEAY